MNALRATDVFTPSDFPQHTYVRRDDERLERRLRDALETPGEVVSVSGPSKSGKTVLVEQVVGNDDLISITGAGLRGGDDLWERILNWIGTPVTVSNNQLTSQGGSITAKAAGEAGLPLLAKASVEGQGQLTSGRSESKTVSYTRYGLQQVVNEIANSSFVILIDDFHYMPREVQTDVAKQIKEAARQGVKICTASVPHRSDDVVRSNPELRGRIRAIDFDYWSADHLKEIAKLGFPLLNLEIDNAALSRFATEASGSPQLMQAICLQTCFALDARTAKGTKTQVTIEPQLCHEILEETATRTDYSSLITKCHRGPKTRGTERKEFIFTDQTRGDVYRAVLLALAANPPRLGFTYSILSQRINNVCSSETPQPASIYQACSQISKMAIDMYPDQRVIEWDDDETIIDIVDPYFLFYLRWSGRMRSLGAEAV